MATAAKSLCRTVQRQLRTQCLPRPQHQRPFSAIHPLRAAADKTPSGSEGYFNDAFFRSLSKDDQAAYRGLTPAERQQMETVDSALRDEFAKDSNTHRELEERIRAELESLNQEYPDMSLPKRVRSFGFFNMGEKENLGPEDDDFKGDDISSIGHGELERSREIREYARLAGWEMPLLANLTKPFEPPTQATPLRFRYTTYLGESHPASRKVVLEVNPLDLQLTPQQTTNLIKLAGVRYNPSTQILKLSCEDHETQAQNKRALGDTLATLIASAKNAENSQWLKDLPVDFRHVKEKKRFQFPEAWLLTEDRKKMLEQKREERAKAQKLRLESPEGLIDGVKQIEEARDLDLGRVEAPVMAEAKAPMAKGKQGKREFSGRGRA